MSVEKSKRNNYTLFPQGTMMLGGFEKHDKLNLSSSTTVAGNNVRYFGDQIVPGDLPSPIENLMTNPFDIQFSSPRASTAANSSGYSSGFYNPNEISKYVSNPILPLDTDKIKFNYGIGSLETINPRVKLEYEEPFTRPTAALQRWIQRENIIKYPKEDSSLFETDSLWSSQTSDVFSNATDSAYLEPQSLRDHNKSFIHRQEKFTEAGRRSRSHPPHKFYTREELMDSIQNHGQDKSNHSPEDQPLYTHQDLVESGQNHVQGMLNQSSGLQPLLKQEELMDSSRNNVQGILNQSSVLQPLHTREELMDRNNVQGVLNQSSGFQPLYTREELMDANRNHVQGKLNQYPRCQPASNIIGNKNSSNGHKEIICKFCFTNKEPYEECKHALKNSCGFVTCPVLYTYICDICGATGSLAHTRKHCPRKIEALLAPKNATNLPFKKWHNGIVTLNE